MKLKSILFPALAVAVIAGSGGCKKDSEEPTPPSPAETGHLSVSFTIMNGSDTFHLSDVLHDAAGHSIRFDTARFFISGIHLHNDGDEVIAEYPAWHELFDAEVPNAQFDLGDLAVQHVHSFAFDVGVDGDANHADPASAGPPLNDLSMHVDQATGYKFIVLAGRVDSNGDGTVDATDDAFHYVVDTDALSGEGEVHVHHDLVAGEHYVIQAWVDMATVLSGVDVLGNLSTSTADNVPLATQVRDGLIAALGPVD